MKYSYKSTDPAAASSVVMLRDGRAMEIRRGDKTTFADGERRFWSSWSEWMATLPDGAAVIESPKLTSWSDWKDTPLSGSHVANPVIRHLEVISSCDTPSTEISYSRESAGTLPVAEMMPALTIEEMSVPDYKTDWGAYKTFFESNIKRMISECFSVKDSANNIPDIVRMFTFIKNHGMPFLYTYHKFRLIMLAKCWEFKTDKRSTAELCELSEWILHQFNDSHSQLPYDCGCCAALEFKTRNTRQSSCPSENNQPTIGAGASTDTKAEFGAMRARIASLEEELTDADSLNKTLREQLAEETRRTDDLKAQLDEADFHRRAFEEANGHLRKDLELASASNTNLERRCEELAEEVATAKAEAAKYRDLFVHLNDRVWVYGSTIADLRRRIERSEPLCRISELEEQVKALRKQNADVTRSLYFEVGESNKWQNRAYAAEASSAAGGYNPSAGAGCGEKPTVGATEVHDLRKQLVAQQELIRERNEARGEIVAVKAAAAEDRANMVHWMERGEAAEKALKEQRAALDQNAVQHGEMTREIERLRATAAQHGDMTQEIERLRAEVAALEERAAVADHEADEAHEESADLGRALAYEGDREYELEAERDRWQERYKDLRRLIAETLAEVEPILERERTMPVGVILRALSLLK